MQTYVPRHLRYLDGRVHDRRMPEEDLVGASRCVVVLGEPGMGKSALLERFAAASGWAIRSAASFVHHPRPEELVRAGKGIVVDGLDELLAARESDPVNRVLRQLIASGCPPFVMSCRVADWKGAVAARDLGAEYGDGPVVMAIEPLGREGAVAFLTGVLGLGRSEEVVDHLDRMGMPEFYGNPLTLRLLAEVASLGGGLPRSRADLLLRACGVMWGEGGEVHGNTRLAALDEDTALSAAGALSAALVLTGSETITLGPQGLSTRGVVHATALRTLPDGEHAPATVGSRLFVAVANGSGGFKPVHRTIAEFLGARWLARSLPDDQARARALAILRVDGGVPASLRGLHAWLAQDSRLAADVISADPYGVLRYGDADGLDVDGGRRLLAALRALQHVDPYFRAEDWETHSAKGLTHVELRADLQGILVADDTTTHLRTLLLGTVRGSAVARALASDIAGIALDRDGRSFTYEERRDAALVVVALDPDHPDRRETLGRLAGLVDPVSTRLSLDVMRNCDFVGFTVDDIVTAVLAHLGPMDADTAEDRNRDRGTSLFLVAHGLPSPLMAPVLDGLAAKISRSDEVEGTSALHELSDFVTALIVRSTQDGPGDPRDLLRWLTLAAGHQGHSDKDRVTLASRFRLDDRTRRTIQGVVLAEGPRGAGYGGYAWHLSELSHGLLPAGEDALHLLGAMAASPDRGEQARETWLEIAAEGLRNGPGPDLVMNAARPFAVGDADLQHRLASLLHPRPPAKWELARAAAREESERLRLRQFADARKAFATQEGALRDGDPRWTGAPAQAYLGDLGGLDGALPPEERLEQWLGPNLRDSALVGFEAGLGRSDMPSLDQVARGYGEGMGYPAVTCLLAGLVRRRREGRGLEDLPWSLVAAVRIAVWNEPRRKGGVVDDVVPAMDALLRRDEAGHERYVRLLVEPSLDRRRTPFHLLSALLRSDGDRDVVTGLAPEWLDRHPDLQADIELDLVDALADAGRVDELRRLCDGRVARGLTDDMQRRTWDAVALMVDPERATVRLDGTPADARLLWAVRHRLGGGRAHGRRAVAVPADTLVWLIGRFRPAWPYRDWPPGVQLGDENPWDASDYVRELVTRLSAHPQGEMGLETLALAPPDGYTASIRHTLERCRSARREVDLPGITLDRLRDVVGSRPPRTTDDLAVVVRFALERLRRELRGSDTDVVNKYWSDGGQPRLEDSCTDRLIEDLRRLLPDYGIKLVPQRDMPNDKRADIVVTLGDAGLPIECKGQWNKDLWTAASQQLDRLYLRDWQSQDRGIYVVYWFGSTVETSRLLRKLPGVAMPPSTPEELRRRLVDGLAPERRASLSIEVLDLTR